MIINARYALFAGMLASSLCVAQPWDERTPSVVLPTEPEPDWIFIGSSLVDVVENKFLGVVGTPGSGMGAAFAFSPDHRFLYTTETFRTRINRGERTDTVTVVDTSTLNPIDEIIIPPKKALTLVLDGTLALSDENRFLAVFNLTPATSISIVDVEARSFVGEISTPGCGLVYAAGERRYISLCVDGGFMTVTLDEEGNELSKTRTAGFFDPELDPVTEKGIRYRDEWLFVSFDGIVHLLDVSGDTPRIGATWSLLSDADRAENWRIAGAQHLALHTATGRLYSMVRQSEEPFGDPGVEDGTEIWVYDIESQTRIQRLEAVPEEDEEDDEDEAEAEEDEDDGASAILVTQGDEPLLIALGGGVSVRDALTGEYIHERLEDVPDEGRLTDP